MPKEPVPLKLKKQLDTFAKYMGIKKAKNIKKPVLFINNKYLKEIAYPDGIIKTYKLSDEEFIRFLIKYDLKHILKTFSNDIKNV